MTRAAASAAWAASAVLVAACSRAPVSVPTEARDARARDEVPMSHPPTASAVSVTASVLAAPLRRPPLVDLQLDVVAKNPTATARWLLVPRDLGNRVGERGVDVLEVERWTGAAGSAELGAFLGTGGFFATQLAPGASLRLRGLTVQWFRHDDEPVPALQILVADTVEIGGRPAESWFPSGPPLVRDARDLDKREVVHSVRFEPSSAEVPVRLGNLQRISLALALP